MYQREILNSLNKWLESKEIIVLFGARQVGKSTLLEIMASQNLKMMILNCENPIIADILQSKDLNRISNLFENNKIIALDEAQVIPEIGSILKLLFDSKNISQKVIATGSSSFELANKTGEPLTGRNVKFKLLPLSIREICSKKGWLGTLEILNDLLVYGSYPGIIDLPVEEKKKKLIEMSGDYLFKDIYKLEQVRGPDVLRKLVKAIALQVGNMVSVPELASLTGVSVITVERYLDLLEKSFVIFKLGSYSNNLRNELKKSRKYYFYDNGIRNAVLNNFVQVDERTDIGALWENYCVAEYLKKNMANETYSNLYFWRTYDGAEIDLLEERDGKLFAFEFKWNPSRKASIPQSLNDTYSIEKFEVVNRQNVDYFLSKNH
ncbi:MAG TPA: ATP-binding protein [Prolixibacteraceae bacterium]|nr:ATP-binding protein [Prolixibacteraceae bacterium]